VADLDEARKIAATKKFERDGSGNLSVFFTRAGKEFKYEFINSNEGLSLKK
jgi:hypothetical protein